LAVCKVPFYFQDWRRRLLDGVSLLLDGLFKRDLRTPNTDRGWSLPETPKRLANDGSKGNQPPNSIERLRDPAKTAGNVAISSVDIPFLLHCLQRLFPTQSSEYEDELDSGDRECITFRRIASSATHT